LASACGDSRGLTGRRALFQHREHHQTGIRFRNDLTETHELNVITYQDFYSGGGVAIGDIDNDGLPDLFLTGNQVQNRLYRNLGNFRFEDITLSAGFEKKTEGWYTGVTLVDINYDGYLDLYICKSGMHEPEFRRNELWINNGDLTFTERAAEWGIDHAGYGVNATFFDLDRDGDLDMFLVNQGPEKLENANVADMRYIPHPYCGDKLYENLGDRFEDITLEAGIYSSTIGFGHGVAAGDIDGDGWEDIFVSNDFFEHDYLYLNNGDKTFREVSAKAFKHISYYSMGNDLADYNNDGLLDIVVVDMIAEGNRRLHANLGGMDQGKFNMTVSLGFQHQYMYNVLHLNNGNNTFSEVGQLAGISNTDWSWGPLFADLDNDGWQDLYVPNGIRKDIRNIDWGVFYGNLLKLTYGKIQFTDTEWNMLLGSMPYEKIKNYMYRNKGDLRFENVADAWGLGRPSWSNGAAYGDLDNDGDLDLVVNNIDDFAFVYENRLNQRTEPPNYLRIKFAGPRLNPLGLGAKVTLYRGRELRHQQLYLTRGYRSGMEPVLHFGLGAWHSVDSLRVIWPDGRRQTVEALSSNQVLTLRHADASEPEHPSVHTDPKLFAEYTAESGIRYRHRENDFNDFLREPLLPNRMSNLGPRIAVGDVNNDGLDDFFIGGALRQPPSLFVQDREGYFTASDTALWLQESGYEDMGAAFFDADNDGDQDLYVVSGGNEYEESGEMLQDRLYTNDGSGNFLRDSTALPEMKFSGSVAVPFDYDGDGLVDLFVGGRQVPGKYPLPADSYLLRNEGGRFVDVTDAVAPGLRKIGMVTSALWLDCDRDGHTDLVLAGEWMPIVIMRNTGGRFERVEGDSGLEHSSGWWYSLAAADLDGDGWEDLVAGNLGLNNKYKATADLPFELFASDFDLNGRLDLVLGYHQDGKLYPVKGRSYATFQVPELGERFSSDNEYAEATLEQLYGKDALGKALHLRAETFASCWIRNLGAGRFEVIPLPVEAQLSAVRGILVRDFTGDGQQEVLVAGNHYGAEVENIRSDAGYGMLLRTGTGVGLTTVPLDRSGFYLDGDVSDLALVSTPRGLYVLGPRNNDRLAVFRINQIPPAVP
jgi:enediyne biosynthesis protein E4